MRQSRQASLLTQAVATSCNLEFELRPLGALSALGRKARTHSKEQIAAIARSIEEFGFTVPVIIDDDNKVLAGHGRLAAARLLDISQVPVIVASHLTAAKKRAFVLAENRLAQLAGWDRDTLRVELDELSSLELDFDLTVIGFTEAEIDAITLCGSDAEDPDQAPDAPSQPATRLGDLWLLGQHRIYCGDALDPASLTALLGDEKARAVFTDPPYNVPVAGHVTSSGRHGEFAMASGEMSDAEFNGFLGRVWDQVLRGLAPGGLAYLCMDWRHVAHVLAGVEGKPLHFLNLLVWDKKVGGMGSFYRSRHELIFLMRHGEEQHINRVELGKHGRDRTNVWAYEGVSGFGAAKARAREMHPTVKPLALVRDALLDCTARGDIVLDFFCGSGTTIIAAHDTHRVGRAVELDPAYVDVSVMRWQDFSGLSATLAGTGETFEQVRERRPRDVSDASAAQAEGA